MGTKGHLSHDVLRQLLRYDPETGKIFWLTRPLEFFNSNGHCKSWNTRYANKEAFTAKNAAGYAHGRIFDCSYQAHRVIWAIQTGKWPVFEIDHVNHDASDNRWINLREATSGQNKANRRSHNRSTSKYLGVCWDKREKKWRAQITSGNRKIAIGYFNCEIEAAKSYDAAALKFHGSFANLNFSEGSIS